MDTSGKADVWMLQAGMRKNYGANSLIPFHPFLILPPGDPFGKINLDKIRNAAPYSIP
jgi:hypothetical protein